jgi:hypothetical protein
MGYKIDNMRVKLVKDALEMAVKNRRYKMKIHPSLEEYNIAVPILLNFPNRRTLFLVQLKIPAHTKMRSQKELMEY